MHIRMDADTQTSSFKTIWRLAVSSVKLESFMSAKIFPDQDLDSSLDLKQLALLIFRIQITRKLGHFCFQEPISIIHDLPSSLLHLTPHFCLTPQHRTRT